MVDRAELIVVIVNLGLGLGFAVPLAKRLVRLGHTRWHGVGSYLMLLTLYFVESVGFMRRRYAQGYDHDWGGVPCLPPRERSETRPLTPRGRDGCRCGRVASFPAGEGHQFGCYDYAC